MNAAKFAELDAATRARIESACKFVEHKIQVLRRRVLTVSGVTLAVAAIWWQSSGIDPRVPLSVAIVIIALVVGQARNEVRKWYKQLVIKRVVEALGHGLTYSPQSSLSKAQFKQMDLFPDRLDVFKSEDQVTGKRNDIDFALHEVRAARRERRGKQTVEVVFFQGLVVTLEFNKNFAGHTIVVPDKDGKFLGGLLGETESRRGKQILRLPNADFENIYTVYSTNDQEAHYLLTPKLQELVLAARQRLGQDVRLAFFQNSLYVTVPSKEDRFEVQLFGTQRVLALSVVDDLAHVVALAEQLIDVLDLETRIWTRV